MSMSIGNCSPWSLSANSNPWRYSYWQTSTSLGRGTNNRRCQCFLNFQVYICENKLHHRIVHWMKSYQTCSHGVSPSVWIWALTSNSTLTCTCMDSPMAITWAAWRSTTFLPTLALVAVLVVMLLAFSGSVGTGRWLYIDWWWHWWQSLQVLVLSQSRDLCRVSTTETMSSY